MPNNLLCRNGIILGSDMNPRGELRNKGSGCGHPPLTVHHLEWASLLLGLEAQRWQAAGLAETLSAPGFVFVHVYFPVGKLRRG